MTGDVHHMSMETKEQEYLDSSEAEIALEYAEIAQEFDVKVTFFVTGKTVMEEEKAIRNLNRLENVEVGGHNYYAFKPKWLYNGLFDKLLGLSCGPSFFQDYEINKTVEAFEKRINLKIISWRNHSYRQDKNTYKLLAKNGIKVVSDERGEGLLEPRKVDFGTGSITSLPINVLPDHSHLLHANKDAEYVERRIEQGWGDPFTHQYYDKNEYLKIVKKSVRNIESSNGIATLLLHPSCMKVVDNFETFREICKFLSDWSTVKVKELE